MKTFKTGLRTFDTRSVRPPPKAADAELLTPEHKAWRLAVCRRAGWRCEWVENGKRCDAAASHGYRMIADHIIERSDGGKPLDGDNGQCLCPSHHAKKTYAERVKRAAR